MCTGNSVGAHISIGERDRQGRMKGNATDNKPAHARPATSSRTHSQTALAVEVHRGWPGKPRPRKRSKHGRGGEGARDAGSHDKGGALKKVMQTWHHLLMPGARNFPAPPRHSPPARRTRWGRAHRPRNAWRRRSPTERYDGS